MNESKASSGRIILLVGESLVLKNLKNLVGSLSGVSRMKFLEVCEDCKNASVSSSTFLKRMNWRSNLFLTVELIELDSM